jgi:23S rRNA-/tRNA-specific pseudouridylate synthase
VPLWSKKQTYQTASKDFTSRYIPNPEGPAFKTFGIFFLYCVLICGLIPRMDIIYKDEHILIMNKPAGLSVLPEGWEPDAPYLVKMLEEEYGKVWVVHRLDKFTSGVLVFAFNAEAHRALNIQFEKHEIEKVYRAITVGAPPWKERITKFPLRVNVGHKHRTMVDNKNGMRSETKFKVLNWVQISPELAEGAALVEARPMSASGRYPIQRA